MFNYNLVGVLLFEEKFPSSEWTRRLLSTGSTLRVDSNLYHDNQWGICDCLSVAPAARKYGTSAACIGSGLNRHGQLLMQVRAELISGSG